MAKNFCILALLFFSVFFPAHAFAQEVYKNNSIFSFLPNEFRSITGQSALKNSIAAVSAESSVAPLSLANPILIDPARGCAADNLKAERFDSQISAAERLNFCWALQSVLSDLNTRWSPDLKAEIEQVWQIFLTQPIRIRPMKKNTSSKILASAESLDEAGDKFNACFYLRPERFRDKSFLLVFMHEARHIYDFYNLWKDRTSITQAELEKRGFRLMGRIYQEMPDKKMPSRMPNFWNNSWENLSAQEISNRREERIEKFMRGNSFYKGLMKEPEKHLVGFTATQVFKPNASFVSNNESKINKEERLPDRLNISQTKETVSQQVKTLSFATERTVNPKSPDELLRAALVNEKNLYYKMDNFIYNQNLQLQCWKNQTVTENYNSDVAINRTPDGSVLENSAENNLQSNKAKKLPTCVSNLDLIKTDATETFWAAPYLDRLPIKFAGFAELDGIRVARYTVLEPTVEKFREINAAYAKNKPLRVFVGTIFVSVEDAPQIIKFWGTSEAENEIRANQTNAMRSYYCATAVRKKLDSGVWVTTLLNTVAVANDKDKIKPYSYIVKYENYRQSESDVRVLDDEQPAAK